MLRDYQQKLLSDIYAAWQQPNVRNVLAVAPTGAGKTKIKAALFGNYRQPGIAIAHRQELVGQISMALAEEGVTHRVIAPDNVIAFCIAKQVRKLKKSFVHPQSPIAVGGIDTLNARHDKLAQFINTVRLWDIDECFPAGTPISTPHGDVPIESVRTGNVVVSFDDRTGCFENRRVLSVMRNKAPRTMFDIVINGRHIRTTAGHPFWTRRGWIEAKDLTTDDDIRVYMHSVRDEFSQRERTPDVPVEENRQRVLLEKMRNDVPRCSAQTTTAETADDKNLPGVLFAACSPERENMRPEMSGGDFVANNERHEPQICIGKNATKQSDARRGSPQSNVEYTQKHRSQAQGDWRQRSRAVVTGTAPDRDTVTVGVHSSTTDQDADASRLRLSDMLQTGYCSSGFNDSNRSGRRIARGQAETGSEERDISEWARVESISLFESGNIEFVYNFEVEGTHTYVAHDVVVHNCHHVLAANKWGRGAKLFTNAFGVGFTATPGRPDRRGLGRHASGVFDVMVMGPNMRPLIDRGYLADYRIFVPPASYVMDETDVSETTGDYKPERLRAKSHNSQITGDIVKHYLRIAPGKRGITFTVDVETANEVAAAFLHHGVPAAAINAKTPDDIRDKVIDKFKAGELKQLVNVDIFGEGFDVPAVEVVSDGRSTKSFPRYAQAFGRALRPAAGKTHGIYIDHVSNVKVHGLPDKPRLWTLDDERGKRRQSDESASVRVCEACFNAYEPFRTSCPYCGHKPVPSNRGAPEFVDGDLIELDPFVLAQMRGEIERIDSNGPSVPRHLLGTPAELRLRRLWGERQSAQETLRQVIDYWAGIERVIHDLSDSELYRKFYHSFGVDVYTAQTFDRYNTEKLITQIRESWI